MTRTWGDPFLTERYDSQSEDLINQGNCGSCYAVASAFVLQKRFEIELMKKVKTPRTQSFSFPILSPQSVLSCSVQNSNEQLLLHTYFYNQGCDGGYPFLVAKHAKEVGLSSDACMPYQGKFCNATDFYDTQPMMRQQLRAEWMSTQTKWNNNFIELGSSQKIIGKYIHYAEKMTAGKNFIDYNYVGGCYECCSEEMMMQEIYFHGPIIVAIDAPDALFLYKDGYHRTAIISISFATELRTGIFDTPPPKHGKICDYPGKQLNGWEYTNHAVSLVGWGEETNPNTLEVTKFWTARNTWGKSWGNQGFFKIVRGKNFGGIESQAVYIDPDFTRGAPTKFFQNLDSSISHSTRLPNFKRKRR
ncbi:cathepsin CPC1 [Cardiosporidium cionae]|uniref:Cathepsin CPC1 n=1 Tax=Cardiosporidium cionae TaxID=476202 RepID=A0ABQ7JGB2_9APIC|nr:cathepsin CPC1 [Cardiosporidium cionae]|eukprot:KAF8823066.1 cathepsin CPC1 [Cardiosporidium cionae]